MLLGKAPEYALLAVVCIAERGIDAPAIQGRQVAKLCGLPFEYLLKILQQLTRAGVLISERGRTGGFRLAKPPDQITLRNIVEAVEGPISGRLGIKRSPHCGRKVEEILERLCTDIADYAGAKLAGLTVQDLQDVR